MIPIFHANCGGKNRIKIEQPTYLPLPWKNQDNDQFYLTISLKKLQHFAAMAGLNTYIDLSLIKPYIAKSKSILEVGGGYGRVLQYFLNNYSSSKLFTIERNSKLYFLLKKMYGNKINIFHEDLINFKTDQQFDLILWLWEGISEFSNQEQFLVLKQLTAALKPNKYLIVDTLFPKMKSLNASHMSGKYSEIAIENSTIKIHRPSLEDMINFTTKLGLKLDYLKYQTTTLRPRILYILKKTIPKNSYETL